MQPEFIPYDLPQTVRTTAAYVLKQQLANALDLSLQAKQAHWNVVGPRFLTLHELFDHVAETVWKLSDVMAERAVQLGGVVEGTAPTVTRDSRLPPYPPGLQDEAAHVRALSTALARFAASVRSASTAAATAGDANTSDVLTQASRTADLLLWKVAAHLSKSGSEPAGKQLREPSLIAAS